MSEILITLMFLHCQMQIAIARVCSVSFPHTDRQYPIHSIFVGGDDVNRCISSQCTFNSILFILVASVVCFFLFLLYVIYTQWIPFTFTTRFNVVFWFVFKDSIVYVNNHSFSIIQ